jgi:ankyrin repeat protein
MIGAIAPADLDACDSQGFTALGVVILGRGPNMDEKVALLLAAGCDPSLAQAPGTTALMAAAAGGLSSIVEQLLARSDAILEATDKDGDTALMRAVLMGHTGVVQLLLDSGADPRAANKKGRTALIHAASRGHEAVVQQLLAGANALPAAADEHGHTALMLAARSGHYPVVAMLLGSVDAQRVNAVDRIGWTALEHAAFEDQDHVVSLLLDHGARLPLWAELARRDDGRGNHYVERIDAKRLSATIREALSPDLDATWAVPPLIGQAEQWIVFDPSRTAMLIEHLARSLAEGHQWINAGPITRLRGMEPAFYPGATLCEAETRTFDGATGLILFVKTSEGCTLLDGTSRPVHKLNEMGQIDVGESENALQYTQFFCSATEGELGPFRIVVSRSELEYVRDLTAHEQYWTSALRVSPPTLPQLSEDPARWTLSASVLYGGLLFHSEFEVLMTRQISMEDDKAQLQEGLPIRIWAFWGKVRQDRTAACNPAAA